MIISIHQPAYIPWLGYFDKIARSAIFVYLDTVQYEKNSFINRNQVKTAQGITWLTIPVKSKGHTKGSLLTTGIDYSQPWQSKHLKTIEMNYKKAPFFAKNFPKLEQITMNPAFSLAEFSLQQLLFWLSEFDIRTKVVRASDLPVHSTKSDLVLDLCKHLGAKRYISGMLGRNYLNENAFEESGVKIEYQNFVPSVYPQLWGDFVPCLSILDYWMNCGSTLNFDLKEV